MTIFLFANVLASGISLANTCDLKSRRTKFILALSLALGVGVTVWPYAFQDRRASSYTANFWPCSDCDNTLKGIRNGVSIFLSTGYCIGTVMAMVLNVILKILRFLMRKKRQKKSKTLQLKNSMVYQCPRGALNFCDVTTRLEEENVQVMATDGI